MIDKAREELRHASALTLTHSTYVRRGVDEVPSGTATGTGEIPAVIVIMEAFGLNDHNQGCH